MSWVVGPAESRTRISTASGADRHRDHIRQQSRRKGHRLSSVGGGTDIARLFKDVRGEQSPGFIRPPGHASVVGSRDAAITEAPTRTRLTVFHDLP
jgi:hypothetical protein